MGPCERLTIRLNLVGISDRSDLSETQSARGTHRKGSAESQHKLVYALANLRQGGRHHHARLHQWEREETRTHIEDTSNEPVTAAVTRLNGKDLRNSGKPTRTHKIINF